MGKKAAEFLLHARSLKSQVIDFRWPDAERAQFGGEMGLSTHELASTSQPGKSND
jgi:hypothetical protein